jgi:hypothetical protein
MDAGEAQLLHGLRLGRGVVVPGAATEANGKIDFDTRVAGSAAAPERKPAGELVAAMEWPTGGYAAALDGDSLTVRYFHSGEFEIDLAAGEIIARPEPGREAMVPVFLAGSVLATVLGLRGAAVMHASTVEVDGMAVAFVGGTGSGKSTAAALLCAAGGALVGDDTARVEERGVRLVVHHGPYEIRLRPRAAPLAARVSAVTRTTPDGRIAVAAIPAAGAATPLGAVVFPRWSADTRTPAVAALRSRDALEVLLRCARVGGWRIPEPALTHFRACTRIATTIRAYELRLSQASLLDEGLPAAVREGLAQGGALE